ncbi:hypothetical protein ACQKMD_09970 [Viridibacillus sp. NPDC096237]|uniref:hypothetical protein n=1 Tax=Viridibacillus sp. NPDC096237 TaxID=3390721 RepID=UPI003D04D79F
MLKSDYDYLCEEVENINFLLSLDLELPSNYLKKISNTISIFNDQFKNQKSLEEDLINNTKENKYRYLYNTENNILIDIYHKEINNDLLNVDYINNIYNQLVIKRNGYIKNLSHINFLTYYKAENNNGAIELLFEANVDETISKYSKELKAFYNKNKMKNNNDILHPFDLNRIRINDLKYIFDFKKDILENIKVMDLDFGNYLENLYNEGFVILKESRVQEGFFVELPYSKKGFVFLSCSGDIDDYFNIIHEIGHLYHQYITSNIDYEHRCTSFEVKEFVAHSFEAIFVRQFASYNVKQVYEIQQKSSVLWNKVLFEFQKKIYDCFEEYKTLECKNRLFVELLKKHTHSYIGNTNKFDIILCNTWMYETMLFETPFYNLEYIYAQINAINILNNHENSIEELQQIFKNGKHIKIDLLKQHIQEYKY